MDAIRFFFGANTKNGFVGFHKTDLYDPRDGWVAYLIKSGAGTGKATFMRRVQQELNARGLETESLCCSSDPASLDAVVCPEIKLCVIDATAPHILEPYAYGECEQLVPFGCCLRAEIALSQSAEWFEAADACTAAHARCCRFLASAGNLLDNNRLLAQATVNNAKIDTVAARLVDKECKKQTNGKETRRFLSAVTPEGYVFLKDTACALCPKLYVIEDEYGAVNVRFMTALREQLLKAGQQIITCYSPLLPDTPSHILVPSVGVGFLSSNGRETVDFPVFRRLHASRFQDTDALRTKKQQLRFNRRAASEMLREAIRCSEDAKAHHDRMEALHIAAMDWDMWQRLADETTNSILRIAESRT